MAAPTYDCTWDVSYASCTSCATITALSDTDRAVFETMAGEYLWNWTGRVFGVCPVTVRPCWVGCSLDTPSFWGLGPYPGRFTSPWQPVLLNGAMVNLHCGSCPGPCTCDGHPYAITLPGPVHTVESVVIDGVEVSDWTVVGDTLLRTGGAEWPVCQTMWKEPTEAGTWMVTYNRGVPVPAGGQLAAGVLASELAKAACADPSCALPRRVQAVTRQGVTIAVLDAFDDIDQGHTGIWLVDSWVASVTKPQMRGGQVRSVDVHPKGRLANAPAAPPPPL